MSSQAPALRIGGYEGPLDHLLEMARGQKVDLARLSILELAEQFCAAVDKAATARTLPLHSLADWVVMAAWLTLLKSRLLLPRGSPEAAAAEAEAEDFRRQLENRAFVQAARSWLETRPQLGQDVWSRGAPEVQECKAQEGPVPHADIVGLLRACLKLLQKPRADGAWTPSPPLLWRLPEAIALLRRVLPGATEAVPILSLLPVTVRSDSTVRPVQRRAALASTFLAGLELVREGEVVMDQAAPFAMPRLSANSSISTRSRSPQPAHPG
ncbi:segregation and condensation protein A [Pseudoroseomonas globiformis]|uniref:Segregation and condensation protein A n=1 Tax=Teichococcus globiformis TaxID=2307229 RepID=A0ABV7G877_9PROT